MKGLLIDPIKRTITQVEHSGDYRQIYELLSDPENGLAVDDFNIVQLDRINTVYVDGEGLLKDPRHFFLLKGYAQPLAGRGLVIGCDHLGDSISTTLTAAALSRIVTYTQATVYGFEHFEGVTGPEHIMGPGVPIIGSRPVFGTAKEEPE
jgi:hypothetical protein